MRRFRHARGEHLLLTSGCLAQNAGHLRHRLLTVHAGQALATLRHHAVNDRVRLGLDHLVVLQVRANLLHGALGHEHGGRVAGVERLRAWTLPLLIGRSRSRRRERVNRHQALETVGRLDLVDVDLEVHVIAGRVQSVHQLLLVLADLRLYFLVGSAIARENVYTLAGYNFFVL